MEELPLYPSLSEEGQKEAVLLIEGFKKQIAKAAEEAIGTLYCDVLPYIESDSWTNFRTQLLAGFQNYGNRKIQAEYDFDTIRAEIFKQFRDEIMAEMPEELRKENERLQREVNQMLNIPF
jgi:hypothetical protein